LGVFEFLHQTVSMSYAVEVLTPTLQRIIVLGLAGIVYEEGSPLPFEQPFWAGPGPGERVDLTDQPLHLLAATTTRARHPDG
jgi:hypothetical protein